MGYGFTLPENPHDAFALSIPTQGQAQTRHAKGPGSGNQNYSQFYLGLTESSSEPILATLSVMVANLRELKSLEGCHSVSNNSQKRVHAQAASQLRKALVARRQKLAMSARNLPAHPVNDRQFHASRYRKGQGNILDFHIDHLTKVLSEYRPSLRVITLEDVLNVAPNPVRGPLRSALQSASVSRNAERIRDQGLQHVVFALFVCMVWNISDEPVDTGLDSDSSTSSSSSSSSTELLHPPLMKWLSFLATAYCHPPHGEGDGRDAAPCRHVNCFCTSAARAPPNSQISSTNPLSLEEQAEEDRAARTAFSIVQRAALHSGSSSVFRNGRWSVEFLKWGLGIWRAEAVTFPISVLHRRSSADSSERAACDPADKAHGAEEREEQALFLDFGGKTATKAVDSGNSPPRKRYKAASG